MSSTSSGKPRTNWAEIVGNTVARFLIVCVVGIISNYAFDYYYVQPKMEAARAALEEERREERAEACKNAEQIRAQTVPDEQRHFAPDEQLQQVEKPGDLVLSLPQTWEEDISVTENASFKRDDQSGLLTITWEPTQCVRHASAEEAVDHVTSFFDDIVLEEEEPETGKVGEALWYRYPVYSCEDDYGARSYGFLEVVLSGRDVYSVVAISHAKSYTEDVHLELIRILDSISGVTDPPQFNEMNSATDGANATRGDAAQGGETEADSEITAAQDEGPMPRFLVSLGEFEAFTVHGTGNDVIAIPATTSWGIRGSFCLLTVTFDSEGHSTLVRQSRDPEDGSLTLVDHTGPYTGTITNMTNVEDTILQDQLAISTDGEWSITFAPMSATKRLASGATYTGDNLLYISGESMSKLHITHEGDGVFQVSASGMEGSQHLVDTTGPYDGDVDWDDPDTLFRVWAEGSWSISW